MEAAKKDVSIQITGPTDSEPEEATIDCCGLRGILEGLPARGFLGRFLCLRPYTSEFNRMNGVATVIAALGLLVVAGYTLEIHSSIVPSVNRTPTNETPTNATPTNLIQSNAPLQFSGPTNQNSINLFLVLVTIIGASLAIYRGISSAICKPNPDPVHPVPDNMDNTDNTSPL